MKPESRKIPLTNNPLKSRFENIVTFMELDVNNTFFGNALKSNNRINFGVWRQNASKVYVLIPTNL